MYKLFFRSIKGDDLVFVRIKRKVYLIDTGCSCEIILFTDKKVCGNVSDTVTGIGGTVHAVIVEKIFEGRLVNCHIIKPTGLGNDVHGVIGLPILRHAKIDFEKCLLTLNLQS